MTEKLTESPNYYKNTRRACHFAYISMSSVFSLPPLLFMTFREIYGISYTLLGTLVMLNFCTQLTIDLIFSFFAKHFNAKLMVRVMPLLTSIGLTVYAIVPTLFPSYAYVGLVIGTIIFSLSAGLSEVLLSPTIAALPSENPEREMSLLHSLYAWGVLIVVSLSTIFLKVFGHDKWMILTLFWAALPILSCVMFCVSPLPKLELAGEENGGGGSENRRFGIALCLGCIFLGSAAENTMTNWISSYMETALGIPKTVGDILGMAAFAMLLGLARTLYAKYGKNISKVLLISMSGAAVCYLAAALCPNLIISMIACVLTGFCTGMLWPGTLIMLEDNFPNPGVAAYALMAAGGDFGGSVAPQLLGIVVDKVSVSSFAVSLGASLSLSPEQVGMKAGMLVAALFPIIGIALLVFIRGCFKKKA